MEEPVAKRKRTRSDGEVTAPQPQVTQHNSPEKTATDNQTEEQKLQAQLARAKANKLKTMLNPLVLAKIFDELPCRDLLNLRETCQGWNSRFIPNIKRKHKPIKLDFSTPDEYNESVRKFCQVMSGSSKIPFANYKLKSVDLDQSVREFWPICGQSVTKLDVKWCWNGKLGSKSKTRAIAMIGAMYEQLRQMPELADLELRIKGPRNSGTSTNEGQDEEMENKHSETEELGFQAFQMEMPKLRRFHFKPNEHDLEFIKVVSWLIQCASGLNVLQLPNPASVDSGIRNDKYLEFLRPTLGRMRDLNTNVHKLKHLEIGMVNRRILKILLDLTDQKGLRLEVFSIEACGPGWESEDYDDDQYDYDEDRQRAEMRQMLTTFLALQAPTLRDLAFWLNHFPDCFDDGISINLPRMGRLHSLTLARNSWDKDRDFHLQYEEGTFASTLPELKRLKLYSNDIDTEWRELERMAHPGVTELHLDTINDIAGISVLPALFPEVIHLELVLGSSSFSDQSPEAFASLWSNWTRLTHLKLELIIPADSVQLDEFLTGVPQLQVPTLRMELNSLVSKANITLDTLWALVRKYKARPGISDLRQLREFKLEWWEIEPSDPLSDVGAYFGLALVGPQLQHISIQKPSVSEHQPDALVSKECVEFMKSNSFFGMFGQAKPMTINIQGKLL